MDEPVVGIRLWTGVNKNNQERSFFYGSKSINYLSGTYTYIPLCTRTWVPGVNRAICGLNQFRLNLKNSEAPLGHLAPHQNCTCGLYAYHPDMANFNPYKWPSPLIKGFVRGWGSMQIHHNGWRSEFAEIMALISPFAITDEIRENLKKLAEFYKVPILPHMQLSSMPIIASEYGAIFPKDMRPPNSEQMDP